MWRLIRLVMLALPMFGVRPSRQTRQALRGVRIASLLGRMFR